MDLSISAHEAGDLVAVSWNEPGSELPSHVRVLDRGLAELVVRAAARLTDPAGVDASGAERLDRLVVVAETVHAHRSQLAAATATTVSTPAVPAAEALADPGLCGARPRLRSATSPHDARLRSRCVTRRAR